MRHLSRTEREQVLTFIQQSQKILAIKYIRHVFNYGLAEAKHDVEQLMLNPDFDPAIAQQDPTLKLEQKRALDQEQSMSCEEVPYKSIELDHLTQELFMITHSGEKSLIDEQHPGWRTIMLLFTLRQFTNEQDYLNQIRLIRNAEDLNLMHQQHQQQQVLKAAQPQNFLFQTFQAQDKKNNMIIAISTLIIMMICIMFVIGTN